MIFLSYSWKDSKIAHHLAETMLSEGLELWIDYRNLKTKKSLRRQIGAAILRCDHFWLIKSPDADQSPWVRFEQRLAARYRKPFYSNDLREITGLSLPTAEFILGMRLRDEISRKPAYFSGGGAIRPQLPH